MSLKGRWTAGRIQLYDGDYTGVAGHGLDFGNVNSSAFLHGGGTATYPLVSASAGNFMSYYLSGSATSGAYRGMYLRLYNTGGGTATSDALRVFNSVHNVTGSTHTGAHISLNFGTTGKLTGLGVASRNTLHIPNQAMSGGGTYAAMQAEIFSDGDDSDPAGMTRLALIRCVNDGTSNGKADVDDDAVLLDLDGFTAGSGNMVSANTASGTTLVFTNWVTLRVNIGGTVHYIPAAQTIAASG